MPTIPPSRSLRQWLALAVAIFAGLDFAAAQESKALIDALVRKGILTNDEADRIATEVREAQHAQEVSASGSRYLRQVTMSGRLQVQYAGLSTTIDGAAAQPPATSHFFLRRIYWGFNAELADHWSTTFNYDFAGSTFDAAFITWKPAAALAIDAGLKKVPFVWDEFSTSSDIRAIERSPLTRYFVESNNGRRLGAGSYRVGVFAGGMLPQGVFYNSALTNPERDETFAGVASAGGKSNNTPAYWGNLGVANKFAGGSYRVAGSVGFLPDQGGRAVGAGNNLTVFGLYGDLQLGDLFLRGEYAASDNRRGAAATRDAKSWGWYLMPCYRIGSLEAVVRYSFVDSDGRGIDLADGVRSAPNGGTMDKLSEWFIGGNVYFHGNDTKLQLGYVHAETKDTVAGAPAKATSDGVRSQVQLSF